ncbi:GtrA family protein [Microlunatus antarcticus]|uniref:Putative flippase GtrA n=1 Tax=Microlunatus antarcticus TaxID=53388 RepID=A0A7W5P6R4_9ACTN|nr:putative flippase GtrA [Microlunatus antarcticus]
MKSLGHYVFVRHRQNWNLLFRFGLVGGSGVLINTLALILLKRTGPHFEDVFIDLPGTAFNIRWYHLFLMVSFLVANLWNFQLNRHFTFRSSKHSGWWREYAPFLAVGLVAQLIGLGLATLLMHPGSPISLPSTVLDNSTGLRTKLYWANLIVIAVTVPLSFVLNKLWTFSSVRGGVHPSLEEEEVAEERDGTAPAPTLVPGSEPDRAA